LGSLLALSSAELKVRHKQCKFPFRYKGHTYHYCTNTDSSTPWCALDEEYVDGRFAQCYPSVCVFPFLYKNKTYDSGTKEDSSSYWCSGTKVYNDVYYPCKDFDGAYDVNIYCVGQDNTKYSTGQSWTENCASYKCLEDGRRSRSVKCRGVGNKCHAVGEENFSCQIDGKVYENKCSCKGDDQNPMTYYPASETIITKETTKEEGKTEGKYIRCAGRKEWTEDCQDYVCNAGMPEVKTTRCKDHKGQCFDLKSTGLPCFVQEKSWPNCSCNLDPRSGMPMLSARG